MRWVQVTPTRVQSDNSLIELHRRVDLKETSLFNESMTTRHIVPDDGPSRRDTGT